MSSLEKELAAATLLIWEAGRRGMRFYGIAAAEEKAGKEPVTQADREANSFLVESLARAFPGDGILAEESGAEEGWEGKSRRWFVDPVDGTKEFLAQNGEFAVMLGLAEEGRPVLGLVLLPAKDLLYFGGPEIGAFRRLSENGPPEPLRVSEVSDPRAMTMAISRSHRADAVDRVARSLGIAKEIRSGSVGIKLGMIASRQADLYLHPASGTRLWDAAAPDAIIRGAGGVLTDCRGRDIPYQEADVVNRSGLVASNGRCHLEIIEALEPIVEQEGL